jgi:hypothetical protein
VNERGGLGVDTIEPGQRLLMETLGGSGFGPASEQSADAAERDRRLGLAS